MYGRFLLASRLSAWVFLALAINKASLAEEPPAAEAASSSATKHVIARYSAAAVIRPRTILNSAAAKMLPTEMLPSLLMEAPLAPLVDVSQIEELVVLFGIDWSLDDMFAVICRFHEGYDCDAVLAHLEPVDDKSFDGIPAVYRLKDVDGFYVALADRTFILAPERALRDMFFAKHATGPLAKHLPAREANSVAHIVCTRETLRDFLGPVLEGSADSPAEFEFFQTVADLLAAAELDVAVLNDQAAVTLTLECDDTHSAERLEQNLAGMLSSADRLVKSQIDAAKSSGASPFTLGQLKYYQRLSAQLAGSVERHREDDRIVLRVKGDALLAAGLGTLLAEGLTPDEPDRGSANSDAYDQAATNLRGISAAISEYQHVHHKLPQSSEAPDGTARLSWRVHLLPFLGAQSLYERFHFDEAWDSAHNRALVAEIPDVYRNTDAPEAGKTLFLLADATTAAITSADEVWSAVADPTIPPAKILVVEANTSRAVEWTKPEVFAFDPADIFAGLGGLRPGGFLALRANGLVDLVSFTTDADEVRACFGRSVAERASVPEPDADAMPADRPRLHVSLTGPKEAVEGGQATFQITVTNTGKIPARNLEIVDRFNAKLEPQRATAANIYDGAEMIWRLPSLDPGKTVVFEVVCKCKKTAGATCNRVLVTGDNDVCETATACLAVVPAKTGVQTISAEREKPAVPGKQNQH